MQTSLVKITTAYSKRFWSFWTEILKSIFFHWVEPKRPADQNSNMLGIAKEYVRGAKNVLLEAWREWYEQKNK